MSATNRGRELLKQYGTPGGKPIADDGDAMSEQLRILIFRDDVPSDVTNEIADLRAQVGVGKGHLDRQNRANYLAGKR